MIDILPDKTMQIRSLETAILGSILMNPDNFSECDLTPEDFVNSNMREIHTAMLTVSKHLPVDLVTVSNQLASSTNRDWSGLLSELAMNAMGSFRHLVPELRRESRLHRAKLLMADHQRRVDVDGMEAIDSLVRELLQLSMTTQQTEFSAQEIMHETINALDAQRKGLGDSIKIGLHGLDNLLGGFHPSDLVVIGARPSVGKTAFLLNLVLAASEPLGIVSAEQPVVQIGQRMLSLSSGVESSRMRSIKHIQEHHWANINSAVRGVNERKIWLNDSPSISIVDVMRQARKWKQSYGIRALYVDYLQRIKSTRKDAPKHEQVGEVANGLKELARELKIPVITLAQVNRQVDSRPNKRPGMGDLSDSSEIEKEADQILTLYRDEVYNSNTEEKHIMEISVEKNRHGPTGHVKAHWDGNTMRVSNIENRYGEARA